MVLSSTKESPVSHASFPVHTPGEDYVVFREDSNHVEVSCSSSISMLDCYFFLTEDTMFDDLRYCKYYENFMVSNSLPYRATESWREQVPGHQMYVYRRLGEKICRMNMLYPSAGEVFYLKLLLLHTAACSFQLTR